MKKIHVLGVALVAMLAFGVVGAVSASATTLEWLANNVAIGTPLASETTGSLTLGSTNGLGLKIEAVVLCVGAFDGTVGPTVEDTINTVLNVNGQAVALSCASVKTCEGNSEVKAVDLPWLSRLEKMSAIPTMLDVLESGGKGNPGWSVSCKTALGTVTETCTGVQGSSLKNTKTGEVEGKFEKELTAECSMGGADSGFVETSATDAIGLILLLNGEALEVSE